MILPVLALRNLNRQKRRTILLGGALAFGVLILTLVNGLVGGILRSMENNLSSVAVGQIFFAEVEKNERGRLIYSIKDDRYLLDTIAKLGIRTTYMARRTMHQGILVYRGDSAMRGLSGIDWKEESGFARNLELLAGSVQDMAASDGIVIPLNAAEKIGLVPAAQPDRKVREAWARLGEAERGSKEAAWAAAREEALRLAVGETVLVELPTIHGQQNLGEFRVKGIYRGRFDFYAYTDRAFLNRLMDLPENGYNQFGMFLEKFSEIDAATARLHQALASRYDLVPLENCTGKGFETIAGDLGKSQFKGSKFIITNINNELGSFKNIFNAVQLAALGFFLVLLSVIMVGITNTFRIVVHERTREIGTMRALGMQRSEVRGLFLMEALFLALGGLAAGFLLGALILAILGLIQWNVMAELSFFFDKGRLLVSLNPVLLGLTVVIVSGVTLLAALIPARKAARLEPAQALRTQF
jgi:putative ABC transport system permease protein